MYIHFKLLCLLCYKVVKIFNQIFQNVICLCGLGAWRGREGQEEAAELERHQL